jgi:hypothetical protein
MDILSNAGESKEAKRQTKVHRDNIVGGRSLTKSNSAMRCIYELHIDDKINNIDLWNGPAAK